MRGLALLGVLALAACTPRPLVSAGLDPYGALPEGDATRRARAVSERLAPALRQRAEPALVAFLDAVTAEAEGHGWRRLGTALDSAEYAQQYTFLTEGGHTPGRAAAEIVETALGLGYPESVVFPPGADRDADPFAGLARVHTVTVERIDDEDAEFNLYRLSGTVGLADGTARPLTLTVLARGSGRFALAVPQG